MINLNLPTIYALTMNSKNYCQLYILCKIVPLILSEFNYLVAKKKKILGMVIYHEMYVALYKIQQY